jgi:transposase
VQINEPAGPAHAQIAPAVTCRCCPGGISRSTRTPRYPWDMSDVEWAVTEPALPAPAWTLGKGGRPAEYCRRDIVDGIRYLVRKESSGGRCLRTSRTGAPSTTTPAGGRKPARPGTCTMSCVGSAGSPRAATPAPPLRSSALSRSRQPRPPGSPAAATTQARRSTAASGTSPSIGLLLTVLITAASVQDRDGAKPLLRNLRKAFPSVRLTWADGGYAGKLVTWAKTKLTPKLTLEIVKRPDDLHTFQVLLPPLGR